MKLLSLFSGIGAFEVAIDEEDIEWELDHYCEIDKYASQSYNMIHGTTDEDNLKDVTNIDFSKLGEIDLVTYGFPCQDISIAGKGKGFFDEDGNLTRSGLFFNAADVIRHTKPKFAIFENVKNLTGKKFTAEFEAVLQTLDMLGYNTYWKVLNAKDYGIPQNRERVFGISIRKDIDRGYEFPKGFELVLRLKDMLEEKVDEKYYLSDDYLGKLFCNDLLEKIQKYGNKKSRYEPMENDTFYPLRSQDFVRTGFSNISYTLSARDYKDPKCVIVKKPNVNNIGNVNPSGKGQNGTVIGVNGIARTITTEKGEGQKILEPKRIFGLFDSEKGKHQAGSIWDKEHIAPTIDTAQGGYRQPLVIVKEATKKGYAEAEIGDSINLEQPNSKTRRGRVGKQVAQTLNTSCNQAVVEPKFKNKNKNINLKKYVDMAIESGCDLPVAVDEQNVNLRKDGTVGTLTTDGSSPKHNNRVMECDYRIRKLTPKECWRLMGFKDEYFDRVVGISNTQLYKQAGNSIVVDVLRYIFRELQKQYPDHIKLKKEN